ncbi:MAG: hypothetical protein ABR557_06165 [Pyrinomonadaceae bacterium]
MRNEEFVQRFKREARAAGRLRHPNVVDVTDFGFARTHGDDVAYLVIEYLDGCTLGDVLKEETRLTCVNWVARALPCRAGGGVGGAGSKRLSVKHLCPNVVRRF